MILEELHSVVHLRDKFLVLYGALKARAIYKDYQIDLLTGLKTEVSASTWFEALRDEPLKADSNFHIHHLFYEFSELCLLENVSSNEILAIELEFKNNLTIKDFKGHDGSIGLREISSPSFDDYEKAFDQCIENLKKGNCYQLNLTFPFHFSYKEKLRPSELYRNLWKNKAARAPFAHATYIPLMDRLFLSNSPECLFQMNDNELWTMPIKGTVKRVGEDWNSRYQELLNSKKDCGELDMITDLLRNDLSAIGESFSKVVKRKSPLVVPGLVHQYSLIKVAIEKKISLYEVIKALFPGGSITGAPKKRVYELLREIEGSPRGFYTGSTIIRSKNFTSASINIRSAICHLGIKELSYNAGGGITLLSNSKSEFDEMRMKCDSFINLIQ